MSLLDAPSRAHAPALKRFEANLRASGEEAHAVLRNLLEEDRVHTSDRAAFQARLATSFATDERNVYRAEDIAGALAGLSTEALQRCRDALRSVGAEDEEIAAWVPVRAVEEMRAIATRDVWWTEPARRLPSRPPRLKSSQEAAAAW
jgi:hypothetical protein